MTARLPWERAEGKVQSWHRDRLATVCVRQSTAAQVQDHAESTRLQYGLAERAVTLGWAPSRVLVIDEDLGHSASGADTRPGFSRLVSEVGLDHVGIVLGIEMSRLARSGREWHQARRGLVSAGQQTIVCETARSARRCQVRGVSGPLASALIDTSSSGSSSSGRMPPAAGPATAASTNRCSGLRSSALAAGSRQSRAVSRMSAWPSAREVSTNSTNACPIFSASFITSSISPTGETEALGCPLPRTRSPGHRGHAREPGGWRTGTPGITPRGTTSSRSRRGRGRRCSRLRPSYLAALDREVSVRVRPQVAVAGELVGPPPGRLQLGSRTSPGQRAI